MLLCSFMQLESLSPKGCQKTRFTLAQNTPVCYNLTDPYLTVENTVDQSENHFPW